MFGGKNKGEKKLSPKEIFEQQIDGLSDGKSLTYKLPEFYHSSFGAFVIIEANPKYGEKKQKKFLAFADSTSDVQPAGKRRELWGFDKGKDMSDRLMQWNAQLVN